MGENFWGTKRFKAPEEYVEGAEIDGKTNVYTLGAMAFHLLGKFSNEDIEQMYKNKSFSPYGSEKWEAGSELYAVALRAVSLVQRKTFCNGKRFL